MNTFFFDSETCINTLLAIIVVLLILFGIYFRKYKYNKITLAKYEVKDILSGVDEVDEGVLRYRLGNRGLRFTDISFALLMKELEMEKALRCRTDNLGRGMNIYSLVCNIPGFDDN